MKWFNLGTRNIMLAGAAILAFPAGAQYMPENDGVENIGADHPAPAAMDIILSNFSFTPTDIMLTGGQEITLHFVNSGSGGHDFTAPGFFAAAQMDEETRKKIGKKGRISLDKGESIYITLVPKAGTYRVKCSHFLHAGFGMRGTIIVG